MNTTDMLTQARAASATANPGQETTGTCLANDFSPTVESMTLEELDIGGSEFSWSSVSSESPQPSPDAPAATFEGTPGEELAVAKGTPPLDQPIVSTTTQTEHAIEPSMRKHSIYFWESITFKVEGVIFQLPKYRFVEDSEVFMEMVQTSKEDGVIELDVALVEFESFLKAFFPRASAMYDDKPTLTKEEWIPVLKLSTLWLFNELRELAISHLSWSWPASDMDPIERICLAKEYNVYNWLLDGYKEVIQRLLSFDDPDGEPMTLTAQEGQRIGMDVALALSGIAIRRMRLDERKSPSTSVESDILDMFKQEFDCVREEEARFRTRAERSEEETRKQQKEEAKKKTEEEARRKEMEEEMAQRVLEEEAEKERVLRGTERKKEAELELERQGEEANNKSQVEEPESLKGVEGLSPDRKLSTKPMKKKTKSQRAKQKELEEEETRRMVSENEKQRMRSEEGNVGGLEDESAGLFGEEEIEKLKREIAKRLEEEQERKWDEEVRKRKDEKDRKIRALAIEELRRRKGLADEESKEEKSKEENTSG